MLPHRIYLSGGGMCAIAHVGALIELSNRIPLKAVKEWMGVSAGSLVAMCLCIGFTLDELYKVCIEFDFTNIKEYDSVPGWLLHFGIDTGEKLHKLIEACLHVKGLSSDLTFKECYEIVKSKKATAEGKNLRGIFHCFSDGVEEAQKVIDLGGFLMGIGGVLTFKNSGVDKVVAHFGLEHFVLETDAPYLAPVPFRGKRNESAYLVHIATKMAEIKGVSIETVAKVTTENSKTIFGI